MLLTITHILFWTIVVIVVLFYATLSVFLWRLTRNEWKQPEGDYTPKTMILFPLRGADPSLPRSLEKVLTQDYPNYAIRFILDSAEDSALPFIESAIEKCGIEKWGNGRAEIKIVNEHFLTASLKNSALYHGIADLDDSFEAIVILDGDTNPPDTWLKRLVEPLSDRRFPAASGLRWYIPDRENAGSLVRYLYNSAITVAQVLCRIPWAGSLALRRDLLNESDLLERWKHSLSTDNVVMPSVKQVNGNIAFVPSLFLVNRETCGLYYFHNWVKRQMLGNKLYAVSWAGVLGHALLISGTLLLLIGTFLTGLFFQNGQVALWSLLSLMIYWLGVFGTLPILEHAILRKLRQYGETNDRRWSFRRTMLTFAMVPVTQAIYSSAIFGLLFLRRVEWRGIEYEISGKQIRMLAYKPYTSRPAKQEEGRSL